MFLLSLFSLYPSISLSKTFLSTILSFCLSVSLSLSLFSSLSQICIFRWLSFCVNYMPQFAQAAQEESSLFLLVNVPG